MGGEGEEGEEKISSHYRNNLEAKSRKYLRQTSHSCPPSLPTQTCFIIPVANCPILTVNQGN